ncbi:MAG: Hint domain-containing protein [Myxococcota bacterium]
MNIRWTIAGLGALALTSGCIIEETSCVAEGARVATPSGLRAIETLAVGDLVWAVDPGSGERHATRVTAIRTATRECLTLQLGSTSLVCTPDHPVYVAETGTYLPAVSFLEGKAETMLRVNEQGTEVVRVQAVRTDAGVHRVFDITVESELHNFVANGVLVHNKSPGCNVGGSPNDPDSCDYMPTSTGDAGEATDTDAETESATEASTGGTGGSEGDSTGNATEGSSDSGADSGSDSGSESGSDSGSGSESGTPE